MEKMIFQVTGMHCAGCAANVERSVKKLSGVSEVYVSIGSRTMELQRDPSVVTTEEILEAVRKAGFEAEVLTQENKGREVVDEEETASYFRRFLTALVFGLLLCCAAMHRMAGLPWFSTTVRADAWIQILLLIPVLIAGRRFYSSGLRTLLRLAPNMDSLIALCTGGAVVYSLFRMVRGEYGHLYFDTAGMIVALIMLGKFLESRSRRKASGAIRELMKLAPETACVVRSGSETEIPVAEVRRGDLLRVRPLLAENTNAVQLCHFLFQTQFFQQRLCPLLWRERRIHIPFFLFPALLHPFPPCLSPTALGVSIQNDLFGKISSERISRTLSPVLYKKVFVCKFQY